ncbi:TPA: HD domain-containing protein, partial [Candidatus Micrarchaeota archaeon]|nr:HD domain-containing protein [Candidatus Micrarchaeota archaeon]
MSRVGRSAEVAAVSGLLHDIGKVFRTGNKSHGEISAEIAGKILSGTLPPDIVDEVCKLVRHHHAQAPPPGVDPVPFYAIKFADWAAANYREVDEVSSDRSPPPSYTVHSPFGYLTGSGDAPKWENAW